MKKQILFSEGQFLAALAHYNARFDNHLYTIATQNKSLEYSLALQDEAQAICGCPFHQLSNRNWGKDALAFLALFA